MVALLAEPDQVAAAIEPYAQQVAIAAVNAPRSLVISGERQAVRAVCATLEAQGVKTKALQVSHAFHSPLMEPMLAEFRQLAAEVSYRTPQLKLISNLTGQWVGEEEITTPEYWCRHILSAVQFASSMETLGQQGYNVLVEIGPKPTLLGMGRQCLPTEERLWLPSLRPGQEDWQVMLESLGQLYVRGVSVDWQGFDRDYPRRRVVLPTYPFQRDRYWVETVESDRHQTPQFLGNGAASKILNPLLGQRLHVAGSQDIRFESHISQHSPKFIEHHRIYEAVILPATAYLEMALSAGAAVFKSDNVLLENVVIQQALMLDEGDRKTIQIVLKPEETATYSFQIFSLSADDTEEATWALHASGNLRAGNPNLDAPLTDLSALQAQYSKTILAEDYYRGLQNRGFDYGTNFQAIARIWQQGGQVLGEIRLPAAIATEADDYQLHPVLLDACFQLLGTSFPENEQQDVYLPMGVDRLQVYCRSSTVLWSQVQRLQAKDANRQQLKADLCLLDEAGNVVAELEGLTFRRVTRKAFKRVMQKALQHSRQKDLGDWLYQIAWQSKALDTNPQLLRAEQSGSWLIFADDGGRGLKLAQLLQEQGDRCVLVSPGSVYQRLQEEHYQIDPSKLEDFQQLLQESLGHLDPPCRGILHLWSLDEVVASDGDVQAAQARSCGSALHLVKALARSEGSERPRLWLVTRGRSGSGCTTDSSLRGASDVVGAWVERSH
jgi:myxalamid-type polyketide synthase MxaB